MIQKLQFLGRRVHFLPVYDQLIAVQIDDQLVKGQFFLCVVGNLTAAQHGVDAGHKLLHLKGFDDVVVGTHLQTRDAVIDLTLGGEHDDGHL